MVSLRNKKNYLWIILDSLSYLELYKSKQQYRTGVYAGSTLFAIQSVSCFFCKTKLFKFYGEPGSSVGSALAYWCNGPVFVPAEGGTLFNLKQGSIAHNISLSSFH